MTPGSNAPRGITRELARYATASRIADLPAEVRAEAVRAFVNWMGCALGGCHEPSVTVAAAMVARLGGAPQASIVGSRQRTDVASAAMVNCISSTCQAFDDAHLPTVTHPSSPAGSALFALCEMQTVSGGDFLNALALAIEIECRLSNALVQPPSKFNSGFYVTGLSGPIGVALGVGNLLRLNEDQMVTAIVLAASQASGFRATNGTMSAHFRPGHAARCGVWSAMLAAEGYTSDDDLLEVRHGFFDVLGPGANLDLVVNGLGQHFELFLNAYKPYPCGIVIHPALDACLEVRQQAGPEARPVSASLRVHPFTLTLCGLRTPATTLESHVSLYHWVAAALVRGRAGLAEAQQDCINDPQVAALRTRIEAMPDEALGREQAIADVTFSDGRTIRSHILNVRGSIARPMTDDELDAKFREQASRVLPSVKVEALLRLCRGVASLPDVGKQIAAAMF